MSNEPTPEEHRAAVRYQITSVIRLVSIVGVGVGIAIAQGVLEAPYWLGVVLAVAGVVAFFFGPALLVRHWKAGDRGER